MFSVRLAALAALVGTACLWGAAVHAQVYRIIGPDGRVTFSDRPPPEGKATPAPSLPLPPSTGPGAPGGLPLELRAAASRFPVTLYTSRECAPCDSARAFLASRGVPFSEKTVSTDADLRALRSLSGTANLPFATLGGQHLVGFSGSEWAQYLDAAGYPKTSALPPAWRNPPATPLVAVETPRRPAQPSAAEPSAKAPEEAQQLPQPLPSDPSPSNPLGIRF
jgi:glutaredoxin